MFMNLTNYIHGHVCEWLDMTASTRVVIRLNVWDELDKSLTRSKKAAGDSETTRPDKDFAWSVTHLT